MIAASVVVMVVALRTSPYASAEMFTPDAAPAAAVVLDIACMSSSILVAQPECTTLSEYVVAEITTELIWGQKTMTARDVTRLHVYFSALFRVISTETWTRRKKRIHWRE